MFSIRLSTSSRFLSFLESVVAKPEPPFHQQVGAELYMRLGHAITQWADVENALLKIFWKLQGEPVFRITSAIFHSPISDQVRIDMVNNVALFLLKKSPLLEEWEKLNEHANRHLRKRNKLAHRTALHDPQDPSKSVLRPGLFDVVRTNMGVTTDTLNAKEVEEIRQSFSRLAQDLEDFAQKIPPPEKLPPKPTT